MCNTWYLFIRYLRRPASHNALHSNTIQIKITSSILSLFGLASPFQLWCWLNIITDMTAARRYLPVHFRRVPCWLTEKYRTCVIWHSTNYVQQPVHTSRLTGTTYKRVLWSTSSNTWAAVPPPTLAVVCSILFISTTQYVPHYGASLQINVYSMSFFSRLQCNPPQHAVGIHSQACTRSVLPAYCMPVSPAGIIAVSVGKG